MLWKLNRGDYLFDKSVLSDCYCNFDKRWNDDFVQIATEIIMKKKDSLGRTNKNSIKPVKVLPTEKIWGIWSINLGSNSCL